MRYLGGKPGLKGNTAANVSQNSTRQLKLQEMLWAGKQIYLNPIE